MLRALRFNESYPEFKNAKKRTSSKILPTKKEQEINDEKGENQNGGWG